jgi:hypothetical protein
MPAELSRIKTALTQIHNVVSANGTVIDHYIPSPKCDGVPLFSC